VLKIAVFLINWIGNKIYVYDSVVVLINLKRCTMVLQNGVFNQWNVEEMTRFIANL